MRKAGFALLFLLAGCVGHGERANYEAKPTLLQTGGFVIYYDSQGPLSFSTKTVDEVPKDAFRVSGVKGRACQYGIAIPITASINPTKISGVRGKGGYRQALEDIRKKYPVLDGVYDIKVDTHEISILGFYKRTCTEILARGYKLRPQKR